ncbi:3'-5' exonuclease [Psychrobacter sp.]|uniref:3'-5' exonuclease n=1 Tax=Psychrobacter sp. TaxID=56811 RepID=UPI0025F6B0A1|nr:3'-5' exonuclease [Psychrobacter sp.]
MNLIQQLKSAWYLKRLTRPEFKDMFTPPEPNSWVAIDCEMTGLNSKKNHLLSIAAIHIDDTKIQSGSGLHLICCPPVMPERDTIVIHGLRPKDVENGLSYEQMLNCLLPFIGNRPIVGYCPQLDLGFLNKLTKSYIGTALPNQVIDIRDLYDRYSGNPTQGISHQAQQLEAICKQLQLPELAAHDAYNDALMTAMVFLHLK